MPFRWSAVGKVKAPVLGSRRLARALIVRKPKKPVIPKRPSHGVAKLIASKFSPGIVKVIPRAEGFVSQIFEHVPVDTRSYPTS